MGAERSKTECYDLLKVLTQILVVVAHTTRMYAGDGAFHPAGASTGLWYLTEYIYSFHMPLFIMLSGCVYGFCLEQGKYRKPLPFVARKAQRLLIPYVFFGCCYVAPVMIYTGLTEGYWQYVRSAILMGGNSRHLWYLLALFWIFLLASLLRPIIEKHPLLVGAISLGICVVTRYMPLRAQLGNAGYYQLFFFGGVYMNRYFPRIQRVLSRFRWTALIFLAAVCLGPFYPGWPIKLIWAWAGIFGILAAVLNGGRVMERFQTTWFFRWSKKNCFGIYLLHPMLIYLAFFWLGQRPVNPWLFSGAVIVVSYFLSGLAATVMRKLKLGLLIGEG